MQAKSFPRSHLPACAPPSYMQDLAGGERSVRQEQNGIYDFFDFTGRLAMAIAPFLQYPAVAIRIGEVGEAGIVSVRRVEPGSETAIPGSDRGLVADFTDRDPVFEQVAPRGLEVRDHQIGVADGA